MSDKNLWIRLRSIGSRSLLSGLMLLAATSNSPLHAQDSVELTASARQTAWRHGALLAEIAWLANPATFHEHLTAVQSGECLEIHGAVSNDSARNLAMKLAREASRMITVDRMQIAAAPALPAPDRSLTMLYRDSVQALYHNCPQLSRSLTVSTQDRGEILVRGEVATLEDKLAVSHALKAVAGCNCVKNQVRTKSINVDVLSATNAKPKLQDNSLLVRLGLMQPRTDMAAPAPLLARSAPPHDAPASDTTRTLLAQSPATGSVQISSLPPIVPSLPTIPPIPPARAGSPYSPIILTSASSGVDVSMLQRAIAFTCGIDQSSVRVLNGDGKMLNVTITASDLETAKQLAPKILAMPELVPYGVNLDITLSK